MLTATLYADNTQPKKKELFNAYPGAYTAKILSVKGTNEIELLAYVWTGYPKNLVASLQGIAVPEINEKSPVCEKKIAEKGLAFTEEFLAKSKKVELHDIYMKDTSTRDGITTISTEEGSLATALINKGLARSSSVDKKTPWCS